MCKTRCLLGGPAIKIYLAIVLALISSGTPAQLIFRNHLETSLLGPKDSIVIWQDDQGGSGEKSDIHARGMDNLFSSKVANHVDQCT